MKMPARFRMWNFMPGVVCLTVAAACAGSSTSPGPDPPEGDRLALTTSHFIFSYSRADSGAIEQIAAIAEAAWPGITARLGASDMPAVRVTFYSTHAELAQAVRPFVGQIPPWATGLATSSRDMHLLSMTPRTPDQISSLGVSVVHEFAHCATLHLKSNSGNNPRWLWESVALYNANQRGDSGRIATILSGVPPTLESLNSFETTQIYDVGYLLAKFIVERKGDAALRELVLSTGDTQAVLGLTSGGFISEWWLWARTQ
jgi:hypothetical protein